MFNLFKKSKLPKGWKGKLCINGQYYIPLKFGDKPITTFGMMKPTELHLNNKLFKKYKSLFYGKNWETEDCITMKTDFFVDGKRKSFTKNNKPIYRLLSISGHKEFLPLFIEWIDERIRGVILRGDNYIPIYKEIWDKSFLSEVNIIHKEKIELCSFGVLKDS